ncbi:MAG: hypothetical protein GY822_02740 [Deltaproteobacteria bacterium]|nr:hypothetical protein [Deltaproteobacteria bacterium]
MNIKAKQGISRGIGGTTKGIAGGKSKVAGPFDKKIAQLGEALQAAEAPVLDTVAFLKSAFAEF